MLVFFATAQSPVDRLRQLAAQAKTPFEQSGYLYALAKRYMYAQPQKGLSLLDSVLLLLPKDSLIQRGDTYMLQGNLYGQLQQLETALEHLSQAEKLFEQQGDSLRLMRVYMNMANCYSLLEDYPTALERLYTVRSYGDRHQLTHKMGSVYSNLVVLNLKQQDYVSMRNYAHQSLAIFEANQSAANVGIAHYNLGLAYYYLDILDTATYHLQ